MNVISSRRIQSGNSLRPIVLALAGCLYALSALPARAQSPSLLFCEGFEAGFTGWSNDTTYTLDKRFAWALATPTNLPPAAHGGAHCAGTINPGNDCYLVSPLLWLPVADQYSNHLWLFYWQWQSYLTNGSCLSDVKIRQMLMDPLGGFYFGPWNIIDPGTAGVIPANSPTWRRRGIDLTLFAGWPVQLGFAHSGTGTPGWFVDDLEIWDIPVLTNWPGVEGFEAGWGACQPDPISVSNCTSLTNWPGVASLERGWGGWHGDSGAWDIGATCGSAPTNLPGGVCCAGTGLDGIDPVVVDARLWSPAFYLPPARPSERVLLQFEQWHDYPNPFGIAVQYSQWWSSIGWIWPQNFYPDPLFVMNQRTWSTMTLDVTSLTGQPLPIRLGFSHSKIMGAGLGWFIDNVRIVPVQLQIVNIDREGANIHLTWTAVGGTTNVLQCSSSPGSGFTNLTSAMMVPGAGASSLDYIHLGAAMNASAKYYRVRQLP